MTSFPGSTRSRWAWSVALVAVAALLVWSGEARDDDPAPAAAGQLAAGAPAGPDGADSANGAGGATDEAGGSGSSSSTGPAVPEASPGATPPSGEGDGDEVPVGKQPTRPPVPLTGTADFGTGLTLRVLRIQPVHGQARAPGEIAGPALQLTLQARNSGDEAVSLDGVVVAVDTGADHAPAVALSEPGGDPFRGQLGAGDSARGVYVYAVAPADRADVRITASYTGQAPAVVLRGAVR